MRDSFVQRLLFAVAVPALVSVSLPGLQAGELPRCQPEVVGLSSSKLDELTPALQKLVDDGKIPGAVAFVGATARWLTSRPWVIAISPPRFR